MMEVNWPGSAVTLGNRVWAAVLETNSLDRASEYRAVRPSPTMRLWGTRGSVTHRGE
jgi:hypothetical protein